MNLRFVVPATFLAVLAPAVLAPAVLAPAVFAQEVENRAPTEEELALTLPSDEWYVPRSSISFGVRVLAKGANVKFGNLGQISSSRTVGADTNGNYSYDNGRVIKDALRDQFETKNAPDQNTAVGVPTFYGEPLGNGRYAAHQVTRAEAGGPLTDTVVGEGLSYNAAVSRDWAVLSAAQINGTLVRFSNYSTRSEGASREKDEGMSSGIELSMSRILGKVGGRFEWSLVGGLALNPVNAKIGGNVRSTLAVYSDYFRLSGPVADGVLGGPTFADFNPAVDGDDQSRETTVPISATPVTGIPGGGQTTTLAGGANVLGNWQVKGAYFMLRFGPQLRTQLTERFGLSAGVGVAGAYSGTRYSVFESITVPDITEPITEERADVASKLLSGLYADVNVDWAATERTGLFAGASMQQFGSYDQSVGGRTAKVELGNSLGIRGGINYKF
jgi:hypothetical protein